jgi:hypothetical protein
MIDSSIENLIMTTQWCEARTPAAAAAPPPAQAGSTSAPAAQPPAAAALYGNTAFDIVQAKWQAQVNDVRAANAARAAHNDTEAMRLWRQIDAEPEVDVAFAGLPLPVTDPPGVYPQTAENLTAIRETDYARSLAWARGMIGVYYQRGLGVPQDYAEAARWYLKSINTRVIEKTLQQGNSERSLAVLYAYGLGVSQDRGRARQLSGQYTDGDANMAMLVRLLDNDDLPKTYNDASFWQEVRTRVAELDADEAKKQATANAVLEAEAQQPIPEVHGKIFVCQLPQAIYLLVLTVNTNAMTARWEWTTTSTGQLCTATFVNGHYGPLWSGDYCEALIAFNSPTQSENVHQTVTVSGSTVMVKGGTMQFNIDLNTGLYRGANGAVAAECHRPQG